jgi:Domain amino terminal to FKBP-type peptidyl-prolyl isomerase
MQAGLKFLAENAKKEGVKVLPSGLQYKVIKSGDASGRHPSVNTPCECHYSGTTITGQEFDSSFKRGQPAGTLLLILLILSHYCELVCVSCAAARLLALLAVDFVMLCSSSCEVKRKMRSLLCCFISSLRVRAFALLRCMLLY